MMKLHLLVYFLLLLFLPLRKEGEATMELTVLLEKELVFLSLLMISEEHDVVLLVK